MPCGPRKWRPVGASPVTSQVISKGTIGNMRNKMGPGPLAEGASPKQVGSGEGKTKIPSAKSNHVSSKSSKVKRALYLNLDAFCRFIGPKNLSKALIDDELTTCLLDNGAQLNFITPALCTGMRNGHHVLGPSGPRDQRPRQYLSGAHGVHHDECQGALCPRI